MKPEQPPSPTPRRIGAGVTVAAVCILAGLLLWFGRLRPAAEPVHRKNDESAPGNTAPVTKRTPEECTRLVQLKSLGVGYLENNEFEKADKPLAELASSLPHDPAGVRNLAIARLLAIQAGHAAPGVEAALDQDRAIEPQSPAPYVLDAFYAAHEKQTVRAVADLMHGMDRAPLDAALPYELFTVSRFAPDPAVRSRAMPALQRAYELDPDNLYLLSEWLVASAEAKNPRIVEALQAAKRLFQPLAASVLQVAKVELLQLIDEATVAAQAEQWPELRVLIQKMNVIRSQDWVQSDLRRLRRDPLAFLLHYAVYDFAPDSACSADQFADLPAGPASGLQFVRLDDAAQIADKLPGIRALDLSDFDLDGRADIAALAGRKLQIFARAADATNWQRIIDLDLEAGLMGFVVSDLDRDVTRASGPRPSPPPPAERQPADPATCLESDPDVIVFGAAGATVLRNELDAATGARSLIAVEQPQEFKSLREIDAALLIDFDQDGDLDVVFSTQTGIRLWANQGDMRFIDQTERSTLPAAALRATSLVAVDWDRDLDLDIVLAGPATKTSPAVAGILENLRHGQFRWIPFDGLLAKLSGTRSLALLDADANGSWDLAGFGASGAQMATTRITSAAATVAGVEAAILSGTPLISGSAWDFDNDSYLDLLGWGKAGLVLLQGLPGAQFKPVAGAIPRLKGSPGSCAVADLDGDGDGDLVVASPEGIVLYDNRTSKGNHSIAISIRGAEATKGGRVNQVGRGSLIEIKAGSLYRRQVVTGAVTHFGLGGTTSVDVARIVWTNGVPQTVFNPKPDQSICEVQTLKGSCPYLYTWTGGKFEFFTDLLWAAPLGLQFAEGVFAPPRAWEYLKIEGQRLQPRDGRYTLQITEELWEAAYFDCVRLIAVDHPADVEIFSNEKVGPADLAAFRVHTVKTRRPPVSARDKRNRDVLETVLNRDGVFMRGFEERFRQGLTEEHFLELDLGEIGTAQQITLFLTGWVYPTDTSLNVAISQNPRLPAPRPPALWAPDAGGTWQEARPYMGFPGGKTKTIAVDLSGLFSGNDHRVRIVTNMEFYWDEAFFTVDEVPAPFDARPLELISADLHFRGFSQRIDPPDGPATYDYQTVSTLPNWPPMRGAFTRFGSVTELLTVEDDRHVVLASGDELTLEFAAGPEPPAGWKRDFLIYNSGWDKDADLHTIYGQDVEPLPFQSMSGYPYTAEESYPDDPPHRDYLHRFQTRRQPTKVFWHQLKMHRNEQPVEKRGLAPEVE